MMKNLSGIDMTREPRAVAAKKKPVLVHADFAASAGQLTTLEGPVSYAKGDALVTGSSAEDRWPVRRSAFLDTYLPVAPTQPAESGLYRKKEVRVRALRVEHPFCIDLPGRRGRLTGQAGDWLVEYAPGEFGVVAADVFSRTYEVG